MHNSMQACGMKVKLPVLHLLPCSPCRGAPSSDTRNLFVPFQKCTTHHAHDIVAPLVGVHEREAHP